MGAGADRQSKERKVSDKQEPKNADPDNLLVRVRRADADDTAALLADAKVYFAVHEADRIDAARFRCLMDHVGTVWAEDLFEYAYEPAEIIARIDAKRTQRAAGLPVIEPKK